MYQVEIKNSGSSVLDINSQGFEFKMDLDGDGMHPPDAMLVGLAACAGVYVRKYFKNAKEKPSGFRIKSWGDLDGEKGSYRFKKINIEIAIEGLQLDEMHVKALHRFVENCPVHNTLRSNPEIEIKIS